MLASPLQSDDLGDCTFSQANFTYARRDPKKTLLYQIVDANYEEFIDSVDGGFGNGLPRHVKNEFKEFLKCGVLEHGFLRVKCEDCHHEKLVAFSCKKRGFCASCGASRMAETAAFLVDTLLPHKPYRQWVISFPYHLRLLFATQPALLTGALTIINRAIETSIINAAGFKKSEAKTGSVAFIQRFGSALNLNIHAHMLYLDGVFRFTDKGARFTRIRTPSQKEVEQVLKKVVHRVTRYLVKQGALIESEEEDDPNTYLSFEPDSELAQLQGLSISYRIGMGPNKGKKAYTLQSYGPIAIEDREPSGVPKYAGYSLHTSVSCKTKQRRKLERLCRYVARSALSDQRLSLSATGKVIYSLKTPYSDGTTHAFCTSSLKPLWQIHGN